MFMPFHNKSSQGLSVDAGFPEYELKPGGTDIAVVASNVSEYVDAVTDAMLRSGIQQQMAAFRYSTFCKLSAA